MGKLRNGRFEIPTGDPNRTIVVAGGKKDGAFYRVYNSGDIDITVNSKTIAPKNSQDFLVAGADIVVEAPSAANRIAEGIYALVGSANGRDTEPSIRSGRIVHATGSKIVEVTAGDAAFYRLFNSADTGSVTVTTSNPQGTSNDVNSGQSIDVAVKRGQTLSVSGTNIEVIYDFLDAE